MLDLHLREHGYEEILPPYVVHEDSLIATGQLPKFEADLFRLEGGPYFLSPTAEVQLVNLHRSEAQRRRQPKPQRMPRRQAMVGTGTVMATTMGRTMMTRQTRRKSRSRR